MLTIGQLADYVGVTIRAVRHYHQRGLLPEPARDASGYRRYDAQAVIDLVRIKTLADAGVPLARIAELLDAEPERFAQAVIGIQAVLTERISVLERHRQAVAELVSGERLSLPAGVVDLLDDLRSIGVSQRAIEIERDGWIILLAQHPEQVPKWATAKRAELAEPEFRQLYLLCDQAGGWAPDDPRLVELVDALVDFQRTRYPDAGQVPEELRVDSSAALALVADRLGESSPTWDRLNELLRERGGQRLSD